MLKPPQAQLFSMRIVNLDTITKQPTEGLDICWNKYLGNAVERVPVLRLFGTTGLGQKCCMHVHNAFPYLFVLYPETHIDKNELNVYMRRLSASIDKQFLNLLRSEGKKVGKQRTVYKIVAVRGKSFYGYHGSEALFLKVCDVVLLICRFIFSFLGVC